MQRVAGNLIRENGFNNITFEAGTVEDIEPLFPGIKFDLVYVFFGALNTVENLKTISEVLYNKLNTEGKWSWDSSTNDIWFLFSLYLMIEEITPC